MENAVQIRSTNVPATLDTAANHLLKAAGDTAPLMKFKKGKFLVGETEIKPGEEFLAFCSSWQQGFVKFVNGEVADRRVGRVADGFVPPERHELDDYDSSKWPAGLDGKPNDPWTLQHYLPVENIASGDVYVFVSSSAGGAMAVRQLCAKYARNIERGLPIVTLGVTEFKSKKFGIVVRPDFKVARWEHEPNARPTAELVDDAIPF